MTQTKRASSRQLPPGHRDYSHIHVEDLPSMRGMSKFFKEKIVALRSALHDFRRMNPEWYWGCDDGDLSPDSPLRTWMVDFSPAGKVWLDVDITAQQEPHLAVSFWKHGPSYLQKAKNLLEDELDIPRMAIQDFLAANLGLRVAADWKGWKITYRFFKQ